MDLGRVGVWAYQLDLLPAPQAQEAARHIEELEIRTLWIPEAVTREAMTNSGLLLAGTQRLNVATGIAAIWGRDAMTMAAAHKTLSEAYPGRFLLGLGVSHQPMVEGLRGHTYAKPYTAMSDYLDAMDGALVLTPEPAEPARRVLAALGPKMLALSAEKGDGAHPYLVTPDHTSGARDIVGPDAWLLPEQAVALESDPARARAIARQHLATYLDLPNYANNWRRLGFDDNDIADGGSDRLVDALVAWGDVEAITSRVQQHLDAGADHVAVQVLPAEATEFALDTWRELAPALLGLD